MIRHALAEGWLILRSRGMISPVLALALAIPISLAGVTVSLRQWLEPVIDLSDRESVVAVLLHPRLDESQRRRWISEESRSHPDWKLVEVEPEELAKRLASWFPYLEEVLQREGPQMLPLMVEITTREPAERARAQGNVRGARRRPDRIGESGGGPGREAVCPRAPPGCRCPDRRSAAARGGVGPSRTPSERRGDRHHAAHGRHRGHRQGAVSRGGAGSGSARCGDLGGSDGGARSAGWQSSPRLSDWRLAAPPSRSWRARFSAPSGCR